MNIIEYIIEYQHFLKNVLDTLNKETPTKKKCISANANHSSFVTRQLSKAILKKSKLLSRLLKKRKADTSGKAHTSGKADTSGKAHTSGKADTSGKAYTSQETVMLNCSASIKINKIAHKNF